MYAYWASIFLLPSEVIDKLTKMCRNYLWGGSEEYKHSPLVSWTTTCLSKNQGGLGVKDFNCWNKALIAKLAWAVASKKDVLWVKWIHGKYLKQKTWWNCQPPSDSRWHWKKICLIKDLFKEGCSDMEWGKWLNLPKYKISSGYKWLMGGQRKSPWAKIPWARTVIPRHGPTVWILMQHRLSTKTKLSKFLPTIDLGCPLCNREEEDAEHLLFRCDYAKEVRTELGKWWQLAVFTADLDQVTDVLCKLRGKSRTAITYAIFAAGVYYIWRARNAIAFQHLTWPSSKVVWEIKEQIRMRILYLNSISGKYTKQIDRILLF